MTGMIETLYRQVKQSAESCGLTTEESKSDFHHSVVLKSSVGEVGRVQLHGDVLHLMKHNEYPPDEKQIEIFNPHFEPELEINTFIRSIDPEQSLGIDVHVSAALITNHALRKLVRRWQPKKN